MAKLAWKELKDEEILYYTIKIRRIRKVAGLGGSRKYKDKLYCIDCRDFSGRGIGFCEPTLKKAFKNLMRELYL